MGDVYQFKVTLKNVAPTEDCGGPWGCADFLKIMSNARDPQYKEMRAWYGGPFDPEAFNPKTVAFFDSQKRLKELLKHV